MKGATSAYLWQLPGGGRARAKDCEKSALTHSPDKGWVPTLSVPSPLALSGTGQDILEFAVASLGQLFIAAKGRKTPPWQVAASHCQREVGPGR